VWQDDLLLSYRRWKTLEVATLTVTRVGQLLGGSAGFAQGIFHTPSILAQIALQERYNDSIVNLIHDISHTHQSIQKCGNNSGINKKASKNKYAPDFLR
jgi:hypothetical protein